MRVWVCWNWSDVMIWPSGTPRMAERPASWVGSVRALMGLTESATTLLFTRPLLAASAPLVPAGMGLEATSTATLPDPATGDSSPLSRRIRKVAIAPTMKTARPRVTITFERLAIGLSAPGRGLS